MGSFYSPLSISSPLCVFKVTEKLLAHRKERNESKDLSHIGGRNKYRNCISPGLLGGTFFRGLLCNYPIIQNSGRTKN